LSALRA